MMRCVIRTREYFVLHLNYAENRFNGSRKQRKNAKFYDIFSSEDKINSNPEMSVYLSFSVAIKQISRLTKSIRCQYVHLPKYNLFLGLSEARQRIPSG